MSTNNLDDLIEAIMINGPEILEDCISIDPKINLYLDRLHIEKLPYPKIPNAIDSKKWFIPEKYQNFDIEKYLMDLCPKENYDRLMQELNLFNRYEMIPVLKMMKYIVDTLREQGVVWGVGRGSSVASYTLYLIGVHKIDSIKYNLPIEEFFKEI
jgi:DNA polymerase III alpha subunit